MMKFEKVNGRNVLGGSAGAASRVLWPLLRTVMPFRAWQSLSGASLLMPYYHMVSDDAVPHVRHLYRYRTVREFEADLDFLLRCFVPVTLADIVAHLRLMHRLPERCFHVTFDDGFREMYDVVAPILVKKGIPATFFLNSGFLDQRGMAHHNKISVLLDRMTQPLSKPVQRELETLLPGASGEQRDSSLLSLRYADRQILDRIATILHVDLHQYIDAAQPYLSSEQVFNLLKQGFTIGAHSVDHPLYLDLSLEEQIAQTRQSIDFLVSRFGIDTRAFAFPHMDAGVGPEFFDVVFNERIVDVTFGTRGLLGHFHPRNVERVGMEKVAGTAAAIFAREYARAVYHRCLARFPARSGQA